MPDPKNGEQVILKHLKARHTEARDLTLSFDRACQRFAAVAHDWNPDGPEGDGPPPRRLAATLRNVKGVRRASDDDDAEVFP